MKKSPVYIVDGCRTPFLKFKGKPGPFRASDLATAASNQLFNRLPISPRDLDEVIFGCMMPTPDEANIARIIGLRIGCDESIPAFTVQRNCASGLQALDTAANNIMLGKADLVLAGGAEAMSHAPVLLNQSMVEWLADFSKAKTMAGKVKVLSRLRGKHLTPIIALMVGLTDPLNGMSMGQTAEELAYRFGVSREEMDSFSVMSHRNADFAHEHGWFSDELVSVYDLKGRVYDRDDGVRNDSTLEGLARLKPYFDKPFGMVTPGNSAQITDGAAVLLLASEKAVMKHNLGVLGEIVDSSWVGVEPSVMGLGPVNAITPIMKRHNLMFNDVNHWEINEAFAAQVLGCINAWDDETYRKEKLNLDHSFGKFNMNKLNVDGGGISIGHPVGASGARIVLHLLNTLKRTETKRGIASLCIGGGQGGAMMVERV